MDNEEARRQADAWCREFNVKKVVGYEEAQRRAIAAGALEPLGFKERIAANVLAANYDPPRRETVRAQTRLETWTRRLMAGGDVATIKKADKRGAFD